MKKIKKKTNLYPEKLQNKQNEILKKINQIEERLLELEKRFLTYGEYINNSRSIR